MPEVGCLAVCLALLFAAYGVLAGVAGGLRRRAHLVRSAEHAAYAVFGLVVIATAILLRALLRHDFTLEYVAAYSSSTLPTQYTVAALWGGQKGSLLFWSFLLTLFTTIVQVQNLERNRALMPFVPATLMTVSVFFLSLGNLLGARWAYEVLGWGGYWAWDPVENAAFMPWLVSTAYLHSVMIQEKRDMLRVWNVVLVLLTFALTIFGTFLTRSGVISSVHSFTQSGLGPFFIGFLVFVLLAAAGPRRAGGGGAGGGRGARRGARPARVRVRDLRARRLRPRHHRAGVLAWHARPAGDAPRERAARARAAGREEPAALRRLPDPRRRGVDLRRDCRVERVPHRGAGDAQAGRRDGGGEVPPPLPKRPRRGETAPPPPPGPGGGGGR